MSDGAELIGALATVTLDLRALEQLDPDAIDRLAELVEARIARRRGGVGDSPSERLLSVDAVADLTGLSRSLVYREIERGHLPAYKVGSRLRVEPAALTNWKERSQVRPRSALPSHQPVRCACRGATSSSFLDELDSIERLAGQAA